MEHNKSQRFLSLRKIAALFPLDTSWHLLRYAQLPSWLLPEVSTTLNCRSSDYVLLWGRRMAGAGTEAVAAEAAEVAVTEAMAAVTESELREPLDAGGLPPNFAQQDLWGYMALTQLNGPLHLTEALLKAYPWFKYVTVALCCDLSANLEGSLREGEVKAHSETGADASAAPHTGAHVLAWLAWLKQHAYWTLAFTQSPAEVSKALKQAHIDIRQLTSTDAVDASIGSLVLALGDGLKELDRAQELGAGAMATALPTSLPASQPALQQPALHGRSSQSEHQAGGAGAVTDPRPSRTGVMYLERLQRAISSVSQGHARRQHLPANELSQAEHYMRLALHEAQQAFAQGEIPVGAVLVDAAGQVVASGYNRTIQAHDITSHAEMEVMRQAGTKLSNHRLNDLTLYVTLEPCCMCAMAAIHARLKRIVYGADEPKTGACGSQFSLAQDSRHNHQLEVFSGVLASECRQLMQDFFAQRRQGDGEL